MSDGPTWAEINKPIPPLRAEPEWSQGNFWYVFDATGRVVAQGRQEMCERISRGEPAL